MGHRTEIAAGTPAAGRPGPVDRLAALARGNGEHAGAWLKAGSAFAIRVASAGVLFVTQILLARWMGSHEFGVYIYAWTLVIVLGDMIPLGFAFTAQRVIPEYRHRAESGLLGGFLRSSRLFVLGFGSLVAAAALGVVHLAGPWLSRADPTVVAVAALALPAYALANLLDGVARSFDRVHLAMLPPFVARPVILLAVMGVAHVAGFTADARAAMIAAVVSTWAVAVGQAFLVDRSLAGERPDGPCEYRFREWLGTSVQIFGAWCFLTLFTYADVIVLNAFASPDKVAIYYAATKTLALTSFVTYAVASVFGHKFVERQVAGDQDGLERLLAFAVTWTFWPSLAMTGFLLALGQPILSLFGADFVAGYELLFILSVGLLARASVGPAERLLTMLGEQRSVAVVYMTAFLANVALALILVPPFDLVGAAAAVAGATVVEAAMLAVLVRRRLGLNAFILPLGAPSGVSADAGGRP